MKRNSYHARSRFWWLLTHGRAISPDPAIWYKGNGAKATIIPIPNPIITPLHIPWYRRILNYIRRMWKTA